MEMKYIMQKEKRSGSCRSVFFVPFFLEFSENLFYT